MINSLPVPLVLPRAYDDGKRSIFAVYQPHCLMVRKPRLALCVGLILSGVLFGCSSIDHPFANSKRLPPDLHLQLFACFVYPEQSRLIVSAPIPRSGDFDIPMPDGQHLQGHIQPHHEKFLVSFKVRLYDGTNVFNDEVERERGYDPGLPPYDEKAPFIYQPCFVLSSNPSPKSFLKRLIAGEREEWERNNPLTARKLAVAKRKFRLMRPGMTKDQVFSMLDLSGYRNRLHSTRLFRSKRSEYGRLPIGSWRAPHADLRRHRFKNKKFSIARWEKFSDFGLCKR